MSDERGQAHALEGVSAALLVVLGLLFAVQVSVTGPLASNTAREAISDQLEGTGESALAVADERDALREAVLDWDTDSTPGFREAGDRTYFIDDDPANAFGDILARTFGDEQVVYNVNVVRWDSTERNSTRMVYSGKPTTGAVTVSRTVTLYDDDRVPSGETLAELGEQGFYVGDQSDGEIYAVARVEVTLWRA